jgi:hypothetical protein
MALYPSVVRSTATTKTIGAFTATRHPSGKAWTITSTESTDDATPVIVDITARVMTERLIAYLQDPCNEHVDWHKVHIEITPLMALQLHIEGTLRVLGIRVQRRENEWHMLARQVLTQPQPGCVVQFCIRSHAAADTFALCAPQSH